ncbi:hypothetical protein Mal64_00770 [Pseudobythopirellula maris]|uniref:BioF2-like acetyltransferase domain-containing protein n=1 Tax=Pseudobythopirellula maris TaxID=2527991 RepID=A0A5C5ZRL5_9BACT|nr:GNAT family N-acetyltransferase [Pseudobythopirellula maris]TWT89698.1 hypothetical protein Mal64_00770 [Pseudobythopirellula maris]
MQVRLLTIADELDALAPEWNQLTCGAPFRRHEWLAGWARVYLSGEARQTPWVLAAYETTAHGEQLLGVAPWRLETSVARGRVIRPLGDGEICTDHLSLLCDDANASRVANGFAEYLTLNQRGWDRLELTDADADDVAIAALLDALGARGCESTSRTAGSCWALELPESWDDFLAMQSKSHRKQLRKAERRADAELSPVWRRVENEADLDSAWPIFVDLHQRRRLSLGEPGCFASERFACFHERVARDLLRAGRLRLGWLELAGEPAAVEYQYLGDEIDGSAGAVYAYQGGVDPDRLDDEPGRLAMIYTIRSAIEEGRPRMDFLRGDEAYKPHWRAEPHATVSHRVVPPRRSARLRAGATGVAEGLRGVLKNGLGAWNGTPAPAAPPTEDATS